MEPRVILSLKNRVGALNVTAPTDKIPARGTREDCTSSTQHVNGMGMRYDVMGKASFYRDQKLEAERGYQRTYY